MFEGRSLSYAALDAQANRLAHHLRGLGVGPEVLVGLCLERSPEMLIGLLGILKAGGAYLPLDPHYPRERLAFMLADAGAAGAGDASGAARHVPEARRRRWCGSTPMQRRSRGSRHRAGAWPRPGAAGQHAAYVIYTSGSTGRPKGVVVTHAALGNFLGAMAEQVPLTAATTGCSPSPPSASTSRRSSSTCRCWPAPQWSSRRATTVQDAQRWRRRSSTAAPVVMQATPTLWQTLIADGGVGDGDLKSLTILTGGEPLPGELARALARPRPWLDQPVRPDRDHDLVRRGRCR